jgi:cytoskeleton protein RodZ
MSLEALERSDLARLPGGIFTRAFIRAYAQEVGLDPDRMIQDFIAELPPDTATATAHPATVEDSVRLESDRKAVTTAIRLVLFSAPIIGLVTYYGTLAMPAEPVSTMPSSVESPLIPPEPVVPQALPQPVAVSVETAAAVTAAAPISELTLEIAPRATCWVSVTADGELTFSGLMNAGNKRIVTAKELILLSVGDAGAFVYALNGQPGRPLGAPGQVVSRKITLSNLNEFVSP